MPRVIWKGAITFGLVHVPVGLYPASQEIGIDFDWLDKRTMDPVGYKRINKRTGKEIDRDDIVKGIKQHDGEYVVLSDEEIKEAYPVLPPVPGRGLPRFDVPPGPRRGLPLAAHRLSSQRVPRGVSSITMPASISPSLIASAAPSPCGPGRPGRWFRATVISAPMTSRRPSEPLPRTTVRRAGPGRER